MKFKCRLRLKLRLMKDPTIKAVGTEAAATEATDLMVKTLTEVDTKREITKIEEVIEMIIIMDKRDNSNIAVGKRRKSSEDRRSRRRSNTILRKKSRTKMMTKKNYLKSKRDLLNKNNTIAKRTYQF